MWIIRKVVKRGDYLNAVVPEHPKATRHGYVLMHRIVMENHLNRRLLDTEVVHHKNGNKHDNRPENLEVMDAVEHIKLHQQHRFLAVVELVCPNCGKEFSRFRHQTHFCKPKVKRTFCTRSCAGKFYAIQRSKS